jgi:hypothetical protein
MTSSQQFRNIPLFSFLLLSVGCFSPDYGGGGFVCAIGGACPTGFTCSPDQICEKAGGGPTDAPDIQIDWIRAHNQTYNSDEENPLLWHTRNFQIRVDVQNFALDSDGGFRVWLQGNVEFDGIHTNDEINLDLPDSVDIGTYELFVQLVNNESAVIAGAIDSWGIEVTSIGGP